MYREISYEVSEPVATIRLKRPKRLNALTNRLLAELRHAIAEAEADANVIGIVLTGEGRGFSAGMDMDALAGNESLASSERDPALAANPGDPEAVADFHEGFGYLLAIQKPLIAAVNGPAAGLGLVIACLCDLRFAGESAVFRTAFSQRGLIAEHGSSWILPRLLGPSRALDLLWHPRKVDANEALQLGLVNRVVADGMVVEEAQNYVRELAENCSPASLRVMKRQVYTALMQPLGDAMREANRLMGESLKQPDFKEGVQSFIKRRPPKFSRLGS